VGAYLPPFSGEFAANTGDTTAVIQPIEGVNGLFMGQTGQRGYLLAGNPAFRGLNDGQNAQPMGLNVALAGH
jgi:hypothetical protein